jgi:uncharacterized membrane protein YdfJ with MMPL/SSD domain
LLFLLLPLGVMLLAALPVLGIQLGAADAGSSPKTTIQRIAYDWLVEGFGPGFNGPLLIAIDTKGDMATADAVQRAVAASEGVTFATPPIPNPAGDTAIVTAYASSAPQDRATAELVERLRSDTIPTALAGTGAVAYVGGAAAAFEDISARIFERIRWFLLFVVGITVLILTMAFRSVVIAIKAALTTILSWAASFGILALVFQQGYGMGLIGLDRTGPIESFLPVFALVFGLSMDYEVFLVSRIREALVGGDAPRHRRGRDHHERRLLRLPDGRRPLDQGVRAGARPRDRPRRLRRAPDARARPDAPARPARLVDPALARPAAAAAHDRAARAASLIRRRRPRPGGSCAPRRGCRSGGL